LFQTNLGLKCEKPHSKNLSVEAYYTYVKEFPFNAQFISFLPAGGKAPVHIG
jgi:hypothetical protein